MKVFDNYAYTGGELSLKDALEKTLFPEYYDRSGTLETLTAEVAQLKEALLNHLALTITNVEQLNKLYGGDRWRYADES